MRWRSVEAIRLLVHNKAYCENEVAAAAANPDPRVLEYVRGHYRVKDHVAASYLDDVLNSTSNVTWKEAGEKLGLPPLTDRNLRNAEELLDEFRNSCFDEPMLSPFPSWAHHNYCQVPNAFDPYPMVTNFLCMFYGELYELSNECNYLDAMQCGTMKAD